MVSATAAFLALVGVASASLYNESSLNHTCLFQKPLLSCSPGAVFGKVDTCCVETYGGLLLSTQFWDTYTGLESKGQQLPPKTWSLHGLWPDFCNGSFTQYCDLSRQYDPLPSPNTTTGTPSGTPVPPWKGPSIGTFLAPFGKLDLLAYMNKYWVAQNQPSADFWGHEFSKHATCYSTFDKECYGPQYREHEEVVDFFETAILYYQRLPTYEWLASKDIRPSNTTTYTFGDIQKTLKHHYGATPYIGCSGPRFNATAAGNGTSDNGFTVLSEVWYYQHVAGRPQNGRSLPVEATGSNTNCAKANGAVHYYQRSNGSEWQK